MDESIIRSDPNLTIIPQLIVDAVVLQPYGAHPSYVQGYYDRDNQFYLEWDRISRNHDDVKEWLDEWVYGTGDWEDYLARLEKKEPAIWKRLASGENLSQPLNYGLYA